MPGSEPGVFQEGYGGASVKTLSALVRLRDEETWVAHALASIVGWCDEVICVLNTCTDRTPEIVEAFAWEHPGIKVYDYPYRIHPMGPGHDECPASDPHSSAALYNFTQSKATCSHATKVDGDMVFMDWAGAEIRRLMDAGHDRITFSGVDIVGNELRHVGCDPVCWKSPNNGVYKLTKETRYDQGPLTQTLKGAPPPTADICKPAFLHFKWARKPLASCTKQWPADWEAIPHFQRIIERRHPVAPYEGEYPASIRGLIDGAGS